MASQLLLVSSNVVNSPLYWSRSLGGSTKSDQMINKLDFSQSHVVIIDQSDACLISFPSHPWLGKLGVNQSFKNAKPYPEIYPRGNPSEDLPSG